MPKKYTYSDLIQFLYHDLPAEQAAALSRCIGQDNDLYSAFGYLQTAKAQLPKDCFNPSTSSINAILQYSRLVHAQP